MRLLYVLLIVVLTEAKRRLGQNRKVSRDDMLVDIPDAVYLDPEKFKLPVPFGHIYKEGFEDPNADGKQPLDIAGLTMLVPKSPEDLEVFIKDKAKSDTQISKQPEPKGFASPRDRYQYLDEMIKDSGSLKSDKWKNVSDPVLFNLASTQQRNVARPRSKLTKSDRKNGKNIPNEITNMPNIDNKSDFFEKNSFNLLTSKREDTENWTTCDEFRRKANFHPKDVVGVDWVPFYMWSLESIVVAQVHRFSYPTKKLVKEYKEQFAPYINKSIDWEQPKLVMKEMIETLLIAADRQGLFHGIPKHDIPSSLKSKSMPIPTITIRLKIIDSYLAMMFCDGNFATMMAVSGNEPKSIGESKSEAAVLKFKGYGYPVFRDIEGDQIRYRAEMQQKLQMENNKFIHYEEKYDVHDTF